MSGFGAGFLSSLQFRLVLGFTFVLALALILVGLSIGIAADRQTGRFEHDREAAQAARVRQFITNYYALRGEWGEGRADLQRILERTGPVAGARIVVYDADGQVVADSHSSNDGESPGRSGRGKGPFWEKVKKFPVHFDEQEVGAFTVVTASLAGPQPPEIVDPNAAEISEVVGRSLFLAGILAAIVGTLLVWLLSRRTLAPLQSLGTAARRLGRGDLSQRAETTGPNEVRELAQSFNLMAADLEEAERHRRNLTADIAHELRTPLTNIQGYLEAMRDGLVQPTPDTIDTIHAQALQLSRLVDDLRLLAQVESGDLQLHLDPVSPSVLLQSCVEAVRLRAEAKGVALTLQAEDSLPAVYVDSTRISQVVGNLLENAITHTPEGGNVTVAVTTANDQVEVMVSDTGPGIAPEDLPRLFDRFYRADPSRSRGTGGSGLGLTIARRLVEAHGGTIDAESVPGQGSRFTVRLPAS